MNEQDYSIYVDDLDEEIIADIDVSDNEFESIKEETSEVYIPEGKCVNELLMLSYLRASQALWTRCAHIIKPEYFSDETRAVITYLMEFERSNSQLPNVDMVYATTGVKIKDPDDTNDPVVIDDIANRVEEHCRYNAATDFLINAAEKISKDKSKSTMDHLLQVMGEVAGISVHQNLGYELHHDMKELLEIAEKSDGLPTGFALLDEALNGGVTIPSYNLVSASSGEGKSIFLQNLAINYARQGKNVIYISLELPEYMIAKRMGAMMAETDIAKIYEQRESVILKLRRDSRKEGQIRMIRLPMRGVTVATLKAYIDSIETSTNLEWKHIMIDYPDLMSSIDPTIRRDDLHNKDQAVASEIYDWAHDRYCPKIIWGASQQVKGAKDEKSARQSGVSGGVGKVHTSDVLIILKRSVEDMAQERCWAYIEKGRNGGAGTRVPIEWSVTTQRMKCTEALRELFEEQNAPENANTDTDQSRRAKIKAKVADPLVKAKTRADSQPEGTKKLMEQLRNRRYGK